MASLIERGDSYYVVYTYEDDDGNKKQKWETYHSEAEANKRKAEIEYHQEIGKIVVPHCESLSDLLEEYVTLYGKKKWSLAAYTSNTGLIKHYINPIIGKLKLNEISARVLERYYQTLQKTRAVRRVTDSKYDEEIRYVEKGTINRIHKLLNSAFTQALKWDLIEKNPAALADAPKHEEKKREIWDLETLAKANEVCTDKRLKLCINVAFACSLRMGELLALTWDSVDISEASIQNNTAYVFINKELQRVSKEAYKVLDKKDVITVFPEGKINPKTLLVLKSPKTTSSVRKVFLPRTVAEMLLQWKRDQDEIKEAFGDEYQDYGLVLANYEGTPTEASKINKSFKKLIAENNLPPVVFHSLRHSSITYKLKLTGGDIKSVQGDSGHAQAKMVTDQYSHILDENRKENAILLENAFYNKKVTEPQPESEPEEETQPEKITAETIQNLLNDPNMVELLRKLSKTVAN